MCAPEKIFIACPSPEMYYLISPNTDVPLTLEGSAVHRRLDYPCIRITGGAARMPPSSKPHDLEGWAQRCMVSPLLLMYQLCLPFLLVKKYWIRTSVVCILI